MLDLLWQLAIFFLGISIGKTRATNMDITNQTSYMQDLIDQAYEERDAVRRMWIEAEERAESWERRFNNLMEDVYSEEKE